MFISVELKRGVLHFFPQNLLKSEIAKIAPIKSTIFENITKKWNPAFQFDANGHIKIAVLER